MKTTDINLYDRKDRIFSNQRWGLFYIEDDHQVSVIETNNAETINSDKEMWLALVDNPEKKQSIKSKNLKSHADKGAQIFLIKSGTVAINMDMEKLLEYHPASKLFTANKVFKIQVKIQLAYKYHPNEEEVNLRQVEDMPSFHKYLVKEQDERGEDEENNKRKIHVCTMLGLVQQMVNVDWYVYKQVFSPDKVNLIRTELTQLKRLRNAKNNLDKDTIGLSIREKQGSSLNAVSVKLRPTAEKILDLAIEETMQILEHPKLEDNPFNAHNWKNGTDEELDNAIADVSPLRQYRVSKLFRRKVSDTLLGYIRKEKVLQDKKPTIGKKGKDKNKPNWDEAILIFELMFTTCLIESYFELKSLLARNPSIRNNLKFDYINRLYVKEKKEEDFVNYLYDNQ